MNIDERNWYLKYRPRTLDDLTLKDHYKQKFQAYLAGTDSVPNLIFVGPPGSGKTTLANILVSNMIKSKNDYLLINGSGLTIDVVRPNPKDPQSGRIAKFASTPPEKSKFRICHIEELQRSTAAIQETYKYLRNLIESTSRYTIFLITTNSISDIDRPLLQRFQIYYFTSLPKDNIKEYLLKILQNENINYNIEDIDYLVEYYYPSVRAMIQTIQQHTVDNSLILDKDVIEINTKVSQLLEYVITSKNIDSNEFVTLVNTLRYNKHFIDFEFIINQILYKLNPYDQIKLAKYVKNIANTSLPEIAILGLLGDILT